MSAEFWSKGYKEVKNVIHNEIGIRKSEILDIFRQVAKEEIRDILSEKQSFIYEVMKQSIQKEMYAAIQDKKYPKISSSLWDYTTESQFKDYVADIMKEEIMNTVRSQFDLSFNIEKKSQ